MNVFERPFEVERAFADLGKDRVQAFADVFRIGSADNALGGKHRGMRLGRCDVLSVKMPIDVNGDVDLFHDCVGAFGEPPAPHLVAHDVLLVCPFTSARGPPPHPLPAARAVI